MAKFNNVGTENGKQRVEFKIEQALGVIGHNAKTNWNKEVNIVKWNGGESKLDIREWDPKHERMSKGITFNEPEAGRLTAILSRSFPDDCWRASNRTTGGTNGYDSIVSSEESSDDIPFEEIVDNNHNEEHQNQELPSDLIHEREEDHNNEVDTEMEEHEDAIAC